MAQSTCDKKIVRVLKKIGLNSANKIADTLQGSVWSALQNDQQLVIKVTNQYMHKHHLAVVGDQKYYVEEDILLEQSILKYLTEAEDCPQSIVQFKRFFRTSSDYYLVMENGGTSLFSFIMTAHNYIKTGKLDIENWQQVVQIIFKQMIECIDYLHSKNVSHFDISLENFLINDVEVEIESYGGYEKIRFIKKDIQIKLCDFGLAQLFTRPQCKSSKFCGKDNYKSPEVVQKKKKFDPKANDIWCLGVCLWMMITGVKPWLTASKSDETFVCIMKGNVMELLVAWNMLHFVDYQLVDLMQSIFQYERNRVCLQKIKQHPWVN